MAYFFPALGYIGLVLILKGLRVQKHVPRQLHFGIGAGLLGISAAFPPQWIFVCCQIAASGVALLNITDRFEWMKKLLIIAAIVGGTYLGILQSADWPTYVGIGGLVGIAVGYGSRQEKEGGHQNFSLGFGGVLMVIYSAIGVYQGVWQALPFLILNLPFSCWALRDFWIQKQSLRPR